jgi:hypothetical protein
MEGDGGSMPAPRPSSRSAGGSVSKGLRSGFRSARRSAIDHAADWEIWGVAHAVLKQHGAAAPRFVAQRLVRWCFLEIERDRLLETSGSTDHGVERCSAA